LFRDTPLIDNTRCFLIASLLSGIGAAAPAGLNATLPLLILALADRFTGSVTLEHPYSLISTSWGLIILLLVLPIELIADKIPRIDHANDLVHTVFRPAAGAFVMMAVCGQGDHINVFVSLIVGMAAAGVVHWFKTVNRPLVTKATGGVGNPILSMAEDLVVIVCTVVSLIVPYAALVALPLCGWLIYWLYVRFRSGEVRLGGLLGPARSA